MFSSCSGECAVCSAGSSCLAGNGDDDFSYATKEQLLERLKTNKYESYRKLMIDTLKRRFNIEY